MPRKERFGTVVSDKMDKTIVVRVEDRKSHKTYGKVQTWSKKYKAHDEQNEAQEGDLVRIVECRPMSRDKCWSLAKVLERKEKV